MSAALAKDPNSDRHSSGIMANDFIMGTLSIFFVLIFGNLWLRRWILQQYVETG